MVKKLVPIHIGPLDISYTNSALLMTIAVGLIMLLLLGTTRRAALVPGRLQSIADCATNSSPAWSARTSAPKASNSFR